MKAHVVSVILSATALVLLSPYPASAQTDLSEWTCEEPIFFDGRWLPANCRSDPNEIAATAEVDSPREPPGHGGHHNKKHKFFSHLHDFFMHDRNSADTRSESVSTSSDGGGGGAGDAVSDTVGGLLGN